MRLRASLACLLVSASVLAIADRAARPDPLGLPPGHKFEVRPDDLPPPYATPSAQNPSQPIPLPRFATLRAPDGFRVNIFADGLIHARWLTVAPDGAVFLAESRAGVVTILRDTDSDGVADLKAPFLTGFRLPHGLAVHGRHLYVADQLFVRRFPYEAGQNRPKISDGRIDFETVTRPGALGRPEGHWTRSLLFSPDGKRFFVTVGSTSNLAEDPEPHATVQVFNADGSDPRTVASGLRNPVGIAAHPETGEIYVTVNERDGMGDELVPDYLTRLRPGEFYGWPYAYIGPNPQPDFAGRRPDMVEETRVPDVLFQSHSTPLGLVFYDGDLFPEAYRDDAFVALRGSFNASEPRGYMVVRVPFEDGRPLGYYESFVTGFWAEGERAPRVWGRPAGLAIAQDGSLLIADDTGNRVWRVSYLGR